MPTLSEELKNEMPKEYIMVFYRESPSDKKLINYGLKALGAMTNAGAKFIVKGMPVRTFEDIMMQRSVIVEFDSTEAPEAAFTSDTLARAAITKAMFAPSRHHARNGHNFRGGAVSTSLYIFIHVVGRNILAANGYAFPTRIRTAVKFSILFQNHI